MLTCGTTISHTGKFHSPEPPKPVKKPIRGGLLHVEEVNSRHSNGVHMQFAARSIAMSAHVVSEPQFSTGEEWDRVYF